MDPRGKQSRCNIKRQIYREIGISVEGRRSEEVACNNDRNNISRWGIVIISLENIMEQEAASSHELLIKVKDEIVKGLEGRKLTIKQ